VTAAPAPALLAEAAHSDVERRVRGCSRPIRLVGSTTRVFKATGEVIERYSSSDELDGVTYVRCGDRRASRCESCSHEYKGDAWHLLSAGVAGGKGVPDTVTEHPAVFVTLTAPSFGPVHGQRRGGLCRPRRDRPTCPHGRPLWCTARHGDDDRRLGEPLCADCYDYVGHVLWQWHAPELWRRFAIALTRTLATRAGIPRGRWGDVARVSYTKVVEFQARGVIHVHAVVRLDGPTGPDSAPAVSLDTDDLAVAVTTAADTIRLVARPDGLEPVALRWGGQVDVRPITTGAHREGRIGDAHPLQVAAYLAKYLTKSTEDFGIEGRVGSAVDARYLGVRPHATRIIATAEHFAAHGGEDYDRLADRYGTLGYRGHPITKTRRYSVTFGQLRRARRAWRQRPPGLDRDAAVRELPDDLDPDGEDTVVELREWRFAGTGYHDADTAALALTSAALARTRRAASAR
jgi:hypothetical protein